MLTILMITLALADVTNSPMPSGEELHAAVAEADALLFWHAFENCDAKAMSELMTEDFRMVHDDGGLIAANRKDFVDGVAGQCASRAPGGEHEGYVNRRLATPGSRRVQALGNWGAVEEGHHSFFERQSDGSWQLTGGARYIHVWQWVDGRLLLDESISIDHGAALPYPPAAD